MSISPNKKLVENNHSSSSTSFNHVKNRIFVSDTTIKPDSNTFLRPKKTVELNTSSYEPFLNNNSNHHSNNNTDNNTKTEIEEYKKIINDLRENQKILFEKLNIPTKETKKNLEEELTEEEKKDLRIKLIDELITYNSSNPNFTFPFENCSLNYLDEVTSRYRKIYNKNKGKYYIEMSLQLIFFGIEKALLKFKINAEGFCSFQTKHLNKYESLINELTDIYFCENTGQFVLSPTQRMFLFTIAQFVLFILFKYFSENPLIKSVLDYLDTFCSNSLANGPAPTHQVENNNNNSSSTPLSNIFSNLFATNANRKNITPLNETPVMKNTSSVKRGSPKK